MDNFFNSDDYHGLERRQYPRVNAFISYSLVSEEDAGKTGGTKNISAGGIAFFAKEKIEINTVLSLAISLPDRTDFQAKAKLVWVEEVSVSWDPNIFYELGVEFLDIEESDREKIAKYVFLRLDKD
ncbi:MAG: PilZ domain-containing protein [Candidatus Omnitrophota bacterium]